MIEHIDEVLSRAIAGDDTPVPRFDIEDENGNVLYANCRLKLKNPIAQEGTRVNKPLLDEFLAASGVTAGSATALTLAQPGFVLADGAMVRFRLHTASGASPTLNIAGTGAKPLRDAVGLGMTTLAAGTWVTAVYSSAANAYIVQSGGASSRILMLKELTASDETVTITLPSGYRRYRLNITGMDVGSITVDNDYNATLNFTEGTVYTGMVTSQIEEDSNELYISDKHPWNLLNVSLDGYTNQTNPGAFMYLDMIKIGSKLYGTMFAQSGRSGNSVGGAFIAGSFVAQGLPGLVLEKDGEFQYNSGAILLEGLV